jgi:pimeloyl-ACP methyl ester carboxylesterase
VGGTWEMFFAETSEVRLHVRRQRAAGRPLLYLHGLGASGVVWQSFARRLNPPWQAICPDLRGHGESDHPIVGYEAEDYARDIARLIDQLGLGPLPVIGHSLGALVAIALAVSDPEKVKTLVLLDPPLDSERDNPEIAEVYRLRHAPPGELERFLSAPILAPVFRQAADAAFEAILHAPRGAQWAWDVAAQIRCPVLLVAADPAEGGVLRPETARTFAALLSRAEVLSIPGAAHTVHVSHAEQVATAVAAFLKRAEGS